MKVYNLTHRLNQALSHLSRNRFRAAEREARAALQLQPAAYTAYTALAQALRAQRRCDEACTVIDEGLSRLAQPEQLTTQEYAERRRTALQLRLIRAACWDTAGDHRSALSELRKLRAAEADSEDCWLITFYFASALHRQHLYEQAEILCHEALLESPPANAPQVYALLASIAEARADTGPALDYCRLVLAGPALVTRRVAVTTFARLLRLAGLQLTVSFCRRYWRQLVRHVRSVV